MSNPIASDGLETAPISIESTDPGIHMRHVLNMDGVRSEIYQRVKALAGEFVRQNGCQPTWVRVSFDLVYKAGPPAFVEPCTICGLVFRTALEYHNIIEVGNSLLEDK
jgi:hypothetical protein